jgi:hypothetical protein
MSNPLLTKDENTAMGLTADLVAAFKKLPVDHPCDLQEFIFHIHAIQNIVLARPAYRLEKKESMNNKTIRVQADKKEGNP